VSAGGRPCSVCDDGRRPAIEAELRSPQRPSYPMLSDGFRPLSSQALRRHHLSHMGGVAPPAEGGVAAVPGGDLVKFGREIETMTLALLKEVEEVGEFGDVARALRLALQTHERLMKAYAARPPEFDPLRDATICTLRDLIAGALSGEPTARAAVLAALRSLGVEGPPG